MPFMKTILGLDIGSHTIKAVEVTHNMRGPQSGRARAHAIAFDEEDLPEDLQRFVGHEHLKTEEVICAIPGDRVSLRRLDFPFRDKKKLNAAVPFAMEGEVPFELDEIVIDWTLVHGSHPASGHTEVLAALTRRSEVANVLSKLDAAEIEPRVLEAEGMVLGNLASVFDLSGNRLLVDLGHRKTTICLLADGHAIHARTVPVAGLAITEAIAEARGCSVDEAERIKCSEGARDPDGEMLPKVKVAIARICREMVRMLEADQGHLVVLPSGQEEQEDERPEVTEITIMGGTSKLSGVADVIYEHMGIGVHPLGDPLDGDFAAIIAGSDSEDDEEDEEDDFEEVDVALYAHALALAVRGSTQPTTALDFRQDEFAYRTNFLQMFSQDLRPTMILAGVAAGLAILSFSVSLGLESSRASALEERSQALYAEVMSGQVSESPVPDLSRALREAQDRADFLGIYGSDLSAVDVLSKLSERIPKDVKVKFEDLNIDRRVVKIKVLGDSYESADRLKSLLTKSPPFSNAEVAKVKTSRGGAGKSFDLTLNIVADGESS